MAAQHPPFPRWAGIDDRRLLVQALVGLAAIAADHAQCDQAAMLLGAADRRWDDAVMAVRGSLGVKRDETTAAVRAALGAVRFAALQTAGHHLSLGDAVALALTISVSGRQLPAPRTIPLTDRQVEVLRLLIAGRSDREIATALFLSPAHGARPRLPSPGQAGRRQSDGGSGGRRPRPARLTPSSATGSSIRCRAAHANPYPRSPNTVISRFRLATGGRMLYDSHRHAYIRKGGAACGR